MPRLFAIDSMAILYRSYFAMIRSPLINSKGLNTSGVFGFLTQILKVIEEESPDYLAVVSDSIEPTFRHQRFPQYKATREKMPEDLVTQLPYLSRLVHALNLPYLIMPGYEADDIIGTLMRVCDEHDIEGIMVTSDKDYMQLISDKRIMLNHKQEKIRAPQVREKFGCAPHQVIDVLGLMGDSSDNVPGVRGIGEKTAIKLIQDYGSIDNIYKNLETIQGAKLRENLENGRELAFLSRELVTIHCEVPIALDLESLHLDKTRLHNNPEFHEILKELEFKSFIKRFSVVPSSTADAPPPNKPPSETLQRSEQSESSPAIEHDTICHCVKKIETWNQVAKNIRQTKMFSFNVWPVGTVPMKNDQIEGIAVSYDSNEVWYLDSELIQSSYSKVMSVFKDLMEDPAITKTGFDLKERFHLLMESNIVPQAPFFDVIVANHLLEPVSKKQNTLEYLIESRLCWKTGQISRKQPEMQLSLLPDETPEIDMHCRNIDGARDLFVLLREQLIQSGMWDSFQTVEMPLLSVLVEIEHNGVSIDTSQLSAISIEFEERLEQISAQVFHLAGESFNINSVPDLQKILYEKMNLHQICGIRPRKIKIGNQMSTDEETLEKMLEHPLPQKILEYRELNKLKNTYIDQLPTFVNKTTGQIHASFHQTVTATGRLSSENPNLQNIPVRTIEGRRIRKVFIPSSAEKILISADYSQIELRIVAHYSKDPTFLKAYRENQDIHALTASAIFNVPIEDVSREMRSRAKEVNFGLIYRMGPERLSVVTQTSKSQAKEFIEKFFLRYQTIHALQEQFMEQARKEGYSLTLMGRRRYLPEINGKGLARSLAEGAAVNTPIQGSAAEIIKLAMIRIHERIKKLKMRSKMILTVHDELVFDAFEDEESQLTQVIKESMENVVTLEVPLVVEVGRAHNWLEAH
ncbi:MAG: DNA polymerase I [SAR324 cluster bacterium]|nr:DNA polymerase I [SAR324 cluster bacterium]